MRESCRPRASVPRHRLSQFAGSEETVAMSQQSLEQVLQTVKNPVELLRNSQDRRLRVPGGAVRVQQLARRAASLARHGGPLRSVAPHGGTARHWARRVQAALLSGDQQLRGLCAEQGQAVRAVQLRRLRHRRRDHVLSRRERVQSRGPRADDQLGAVPRGDRRLQRRRCAATIARPRTRAARRSSVSTTATRCRARTRPGSSRS